MKTVITDLRINAECERSLFAFGYELIKLPPSKYLQKPVASHPDMLVFVDGDRLITHKKYYVEAKEAVDEIISKCGLSLVLSNEEWRADYPHDVLFNAAKVGGKLICREKSTSTLIRGERVNVKQGYAKCSACIVGDGIITADRSIARAWDDTLLLDTSCVLLDGYDEGFIGGASGDDGEHIFFCGDITKHPQYKEIEAFCRAHGRKPVSLSKAPLYDYGSLIFV